MNDHPLIIAMGKAFMMMLCMAAMIGFGICMAALIAWWPWFGLILVFALIFAGFTWIFLQE